MSTLPTGAAKHPDADLLGRYVDTSYKVYVATLCPRRGLLLTRQLSDRLSEAFAYDAAAFRKQLHFGTFTKQP